MGPILLDTHYWVWMSDASLGELKPRERRVIADSASKGELLVSVISVWELALLEAKGRLVLDSPCHVWVSKALSAPGLSLAPLTPEIAVDASRLPGEFHGDPADRIIAATARRLEARLLTRDQRLREYAGRGFLNLA